MIYFVSSVCTQYVFVCLFYMPQMLERRTVFGRARKQISQTLVVEDALQPTAPAAELLLVTAPAADPLLVSAPAAEPLLASRALPRDEFNDAYEDDDDDFELRWTHISARHLGHILTLKTLITSRCAKCRVKNSNKKLKNAPTASYVKSSDRTIWIRHITSTALTSSYNI